MIKTQSAYISNNQVKFLVPAYTKLLNILYSSNEQFTILYEDNQNEETKSIIVEFWDGINPNIYHPNYEFNYWKTITCANPILTSSTSGMGTNTNISVNLINSVKYFHIFVKEVLSTAEMRNKKIEEII